MRRRERGSQFVEAGLVLVPFLALLLLIVDTGYGVWVKATLQHAVREGVRYGVTGQTSGANGQAASAAAVVQSHAMGLLNAAPNVIAVRYYDPSSFTPTASNAAGNVMEVSVENYKLKPLAPLLRSNGNTLITVRAADIVEPPPGGVAPKP